MTYYSIQQLKIILISTMNIENQSSPPSLLTLSSDVLLYIFQFSTSSIKEFHDYNHINKLWNNLLSSQNNNLSKIIRNRISVCVAIRIEFSDEDDYAKYIETRSSYIFTTIS